MQCGAVQYGTVQYGAVQYYAVQHGSVQHGAVQYNAVSDNQGIGAHFSSVQYRRQTKKDPGADSSLVSFSPHQITLWTVLSVFYNKLSCVLLMTQFQIEGKGFVQGDTK